MEPIKSYKMTHKESGSESVIDIGVDSSKKIKILSVSLRKGKVIEMKLVKEALFLASKELIKE